MAFVLDRISKCLQAALLISRCLKAKKSKQVTAQVAKDFLLYTSALFAQVSFMQLNYPRLVLYIFSLGSDV